MGSALFSRTRPGLLLGGSDRLDPLGKQGTAPRGPSTTRPGVSDNDAWAVSVFLGVVAGLFWGIVVGRALWEPPGGPDDAVLCFFAGLLAWVVTGVPSGLCAHECLSNWSGK